MSNKIQVIQDKSGNNVFPITHEKAVRDSAGVSLDAKLAALESKTYVEAWDGASTPVVANIPAGIVVTYEGTNYTGTLAASSSTDGKIYLIKDGTEYDRYASTTNLAGTRVWTYLGTTAMSLTGYATKDELNQLSQEVVKYSAKAESTQDVNILDPNTLIISTNFLGRANGSLKNNGYGYTDFIEIPPEGLVINNAFTASGASGCCGVYYDEDKQYSGYSGYPGVEPSATHKYIRFNLGNPANFSEGENYAIYIGHHVPVYQPYSPVRTGRISGAIIAENSIPITKLADVKSKNLVRKIYTGIYYNYGNNIYNNGNFDATPVMYVKPSTAYVLRANAKYIAIFNTDGTKSRQLTNASAFTTSASESMVIVSFYQTTAKEYQLEEGNTPTAYSPYAPQLDPAVVPYKEIPDGSVTRQKIAPGVSLQASPNKFNAFRVNGEILAGNKLTGVSVLFKTSQVLTVELFGVVEDVAIGAGDMVMYGAWLRVTPTSAQVIYGEGSTVFATYNHGLTLGSHTKIIFMMGESPTFRIINDSGASYSNTMRGFVGAPFVRNDGSLSITASLAYGSRMGDARIWVAGDSYWSPNDNARIPANLATMGVSNYLLLSRGGVSAQGLLPSIQALIEQGMRPSYIVWALGMNNGTDSNGEVNTNWLAAVTTFLALCDDAGITPVFCTIPTVPSFAHDALNTWIRESGYRYIDTAAEVEKEGTATWRGWGTADALLSSDQVHPTAAGALQLAGRILVDFPEIAQINP